MGSYSKSQIVKTNKGDITYGEVLDLRKANKKAAEESGDKTFDGVMYCARCLERGEKETFRILSAAQCCGCNRHKPSRKTPTKKQAKPEAKEPCKQCLEHANTITMMKTSRGALNIDSMNKTTKISDLEQLVAELREELDNERQAHDITNQSLKTSEELAVEQGLRLEEYAADEKIQDQVIENLQKSNDTKSKKITELEIEIVELNEENDEIAVHLLTAQRKAKPST